MQCPKCGQENPENVQFCTRCHLTLRFVCPACRHSQEHGGKCDVCGVDFAKYAAVLLSQASSSVQEKRTRRRETASLVRQLALVPLTGGISLLTYLFKRIRR